MTEEFKNFIKRLESLADHAQAEAVRTGDHNLLYVESCLCVVVGFMHAGSVKELAMHLARMADGKLKALNCRNN